jgi:transcriptional regulator with XRE-family HTH domain
MTPFGERVRELRRSRAIALKRMAADLQLSPAYLSALEHGHRGRPTEALVVQVCEYFNLIWDDFEEMHRLAARSDPRIAIDTSGLSPRATEFANLLAARIAGLDDATLARLIGEIDRSPIGAPRAPRARPRCRSRRQE